MKMGAWVGIATGSIVVGATCAVAGPVAAAGDHPAAASPVSEAFFGAVSVQHSSDVWALEETVPSNGGHGGGKIFLDHLHNGHWSQRRVAGPSDGRVGGIVAASASTPWLWGTGPTNGGAIWRLVGHKLKSVPVPTAVTKDDLGTRAVVGSSLTNVWIVGEDHSEVKPLAYHWNGKSWKNTRIPRSGSYTQVSNIATSSPTNAIAYGQSDSGLPAWIWNGKKWRAVPRTLPTYAAATTGPTHSYLIGSETANPNKPPALCVLKWNGKKWSKTSTPSPDPVTVQSAVAVGSKTVFISGFSSSRGVQSPIIAKFANGKLRYQKTPKVGGIGTQLRAVVASSPSVAMAFGFSSTTSSDPYEPDEHLLAEAYNGHAWKVVKSVPK